MLNTGVYIYFNFLPNDSFNMRKYCYKLAIQITLQNRSRGKDGRDPSFPSNVVKMKKNYKFYVLFHLHIIVGNKK